MDKRSKGRKLSDTTKTVKLKHTDKTTCFLQKSEKNYENSNRNF